MASPQDNDIHAVEQEDANNRLKLMRIGYQERRKSLEMKIEALGVFPQGRRSSSSSAISRGEDVGEVSDFAYRNLRKIHQRDTADDVANRLYADAKQRSINRHIAGIEEQQRVKKRAIPRVNPSTSLRVDTGAGQQNNRASVYERLFQQADQRRRRIAAKARAQRDARILYDQEVDDEKRLGIEALHEHAERGAAMVKVRSPLFYASYHEKREKKLQAKRKQSEVGDCTFAPEINAYSAKLVQRSRLRREPLYERLFRLGMRSNRAATTQRPRAQSEMGGQFIPDYEIRQRNVSSPPPPSHFLNSSASFEADANRVATTVDEEQGDEPPLSRINEEDEPIRGTTERKEGADDAVETNEDRKVLNRQNAHGASGKDLEQAPAGEYLQSMKEDAEGSSVEEQQEDADAGADEDETNSLEGYKRENVQAWKHGAFGHPHKALLTVDLRAILWTSKDGSLNFITWEEVLMALPAVVRNKAKRRQVGSFSQMLKFRRPGQASSNESRYYISIVAKVGRKPLVLSFSEEAERDDILQSITAILESVISPNKPASASTRRRSSMPPSHPPVVKLTGGQPARERGQSAAAC